MNDPRITNSLSEKLSVGINLYLDIKITDTAGLENFLKSELLSIQENHQKKIPPGFDWSRKLYSELHIDPTKHRPSSEALWRRLKNKNDFPAVNPFVNLTNLLSLKFQICFGLYDLEKIKGNVNICVGQKADRFCGIRKDILNLEGKIVLKDSEGAFGNPSSDSLRTSVDVSTIRILQVLFFHPSDPDAIEITRRAFQTFKQFFPVSVSHSRML